MNYKDWITREFIFHHIELIESWARDMTFGCAKHWQIAEQIKEIIDEHWCKKSELSNSFFTITIGFPLQEINWTEIANEYLSLVEDFYEHCDYTIV